MRVEFRSPIATDPNPVWRLEEGHVWSDPLHVPWLDLRFATGSPVPSHSPAVPDGTEVCPLEVQLRGVFPREWVVDRIGHNPSRVVFENHQGYHVALRVHPSPRLVGLLEAVAASASARVKP